MIVDYHSGNLSSPRVTQDGTNYVVVSTAEGMPVVVVINYYGRIYISTAEDKDFADIVRSLGLSDRVPAEKVEQMLCAR